MKILNKRIENGYEITDYTEDGETVSHTVKVPVQKENSPIEPQLKEPTNSEIAQMISDLQADLIIAGVI